MHSDPCPLAVTHDLVTVQDFAQAVVTAIRDRELAQRLAENGRRLVEETYDWRVMYRDLDEVHEEIGR